jgi:hypothetical protein
VSSYAFSSIHLPENRDTVARNSAPQNPASGD